MEGIAFDLPTNDHQQLFDQFWESTKKFIAKRNSMPPKCALIIADQRVELINVTEIGGFHALSSYILTREQNTENPLQSLIVCFEIVEPNTLDGDLIAILFAHNAAYPIAKMAHWMLVNNRVICTDSYTGKIMIDKIQDMLIDFPVQKMGFA